MAKRTETDDSSGELTTMLLDPHPAGNLSFLCGAVYPPVAVRALGSPVIGAADDTITYLPV